MKENELALLLAAMGGASGGGSGPSPSTIAPAMDGTASVGSSTQYARADHVHPSDTSKITAPSNPYSGQFLVYNGSAWVAQTLATWQASSY